MDNEQVAAPGSEAAAGLEAAGLSVRPAHFSRIAALRYFDATGAFVTDLAAVAGLAGGALPGEPPAPGSLAPGPLQAVRHAAGPDGAEIILAWRSPTETLALCSDAETFAALERRAAGRSDGCVVDQTGGILARTIAGARAPELLARLGATTALPVPGEARTARLAEISATALCIRSGEIVVLVERVYDAHLMGWIAAAIADM